MTRTSRGSRAVIENLESRMLLAQAASVAMPAQEVQPVAGLVRSFHYTTPQGAKVTVSVSGYGNLAGSTVESDGALDLVYASTTAASKITIDVKGGGAPLDTVRNANLELTDDTGVGGQILGALLGPKVDLISGGQINLTSGIGRLQLRSVASNTQIHLRDLPQTVQPTEIINGVEVPGNVASSSGSSSSFSSSSGSTTGSTGVVTGGNGLPVLIPSGEAAVAAGLPYTNVAPSSSNDDGRVLAYGNSTSTGSTLESVSGVFEPTLNLITTPNPANPGTPPAPPGVVVQIAHVNASANGTGTISNGDLWAYDPTANTLIEFNALTGAQVNTIAVGGSSNPHGVVSLGVLGNEQVVMLARFATVQVFDATSGAAIGSFTATNLGTNGFLITGIAGSGTSTVITGGNADTVNGAGSPIVAPINLAASLADQTAQLSGSELSLPAYLAQSATTIPGSNTIYALDYTTFPQTSGVNALGVATFTGAQLGSPKQAAATPIPNPNNTNGTTPYINTEQLIAGTTSPPVLSSVEGQLALDLGVQNGGNVLNLLNPSTFAATGTKIDLDDANLLSGISQTFHPELAGSALVDVQGNVQSFAATNASGLALNVNGNLNLVSISKAADSTVVGQPLSHVAIGQRSNVTLVTPYRAVGDRNGVTISSSLRPLGPLTLPE